MEPGSDSLADWSPPKGYQQVGSELEGITVYAPIPEAPVLPDEVTYKCPNCGGTTRYNVAAGGVACEHCGYRAPVATEAVGRGAQEFEFTVETWQRAEKGWGVARQELHCDSCGANLTLAEGALTITCPFCASNRVSLRAAAGEVLRPQVLVPFQIKPEDTRARASEWLGKGWYHPAELVSASVIDRFHGVYLPYWTFDTRILADWQAEVGYPRQERYYDAGSKTWQTRTVIDWRWEKGEVQVTIDDMLVCGSARMSPVILGRLEPFHLDALVEYSPDYLAGWDAQAYDIPLPDAWEKAKNRMRELGKKACYDDIHSGHVRNFKMQADFQDEVWRYTLLPVYVAAYRFEDKAYQVMVNGQTGLVAGQKPVAWWKVWLAILALLTPGVVLGLIGLPLIALGGAGLVLIVAGFVLLVLGGVLSVYLYRQAAASEAA